MIPMSLAEIFAIPFFICVSSRALTYDMSTTISATLKKDGLFPSRSSLPSTPWKMIGNPFKYAKWKRLCRIPNKLILIKSVLVKVQCCLLIQTVYREQYSAKWLGMGEVSSSEIWNFGASWKILMKYIESQ